MTVKRDGAEKKISADNLVPGDLILIKQGDEIPCDIIFVESSGLKINRSRYASEDLDISEDISIDLDAKALPGIFETQNVGLYGSKCTSGQGWGICVKTGDACLLVSISSI